MKRKIVIALVLAAFCILGTGVSQAQPQPTPAVVVQTDWVSTHLKDANLVILHVGANRGIYDAGHIPGARFLPMSDLTIVRPGSPNKLPVQEVKSAFERLGVGDGTRVLIYGDSPIFAGRAYFALDYLGHGNDVSILDGGLEKWKTDKNPTDLAPPEPKQATLTVKLRPELLVDLPAVQQIAANKKVLLIDGRPPAQYSGVEPGDGITRGGHIPGAENLFWMRLLVSKENPVLKPLADMRALYEAAGLKPGEEVVVYCRTGVIAAYEYTTLKLLGYRPRLYDGSFMEWSTTPGTQVAR